MPRSLPARWSTIGACLSLAAIGLGCTAPMGSTGSIVDLRKDLEQADRRAGSVASPSTIDRGSAGGGDKTIDIAVTTSPSAPPDTTVDRPGAGFPPLGAVGTGTTASANDSSDPALDQFARDLSRASGMDPIAKQALIDDLRQSDPALRSQLIRQFRMMLAYKNRLSQQSGEASLQTASLQSASISPADANNESILPIASNSGQRAARKPQPPAGVTASDDATDAAAAPQTLATVKEHSQALTANRGGSDAKSANDTHDSAVAPASCTVDGVRLRPPLKPRDAQLNLPTAADQPTKPQKPAPATAEVADDNQAQLTRTILSLEATSGSGSSPDDLRRQTQLRMLYLAAGRRDDALRPIPGLSAAQQEFWTKELFGLSTYLDTDRAPDAERRATEAAGSLRQAATQIGQLANPVVRNLAFCKEVTSFGVYKKFPKYEFKPGDEALLYAEIENLKAESTDRGYRSCVKSSYEILDTRGERVADQQFPPSEDLCANERRDFFIPYFMSIPKRINPGDYTLQLTVEDTVGQKIGQASIQFSVK